MKIKYTGIFLIFLTFSMVFATQENFKSLKNLINTENFCQINSNQIYDLIDDYTLEFMKEKINEETHQVPSYLMDLVKGEQVEVIINQNQNKFYFTVFMDDLIVDNIEKQISNDPTIRIEIEHNVLCMMFENSKEGNKINPNEMIKEISKYYQNGQIKYRRLDGDFVKEILVNIGMFLLRFF